MSALTQDPVAEAARVSPDAVAIVHPEGDFTYAALESFVAGTARNLQSLGQRRVGVCLPAGWEALVLILASMRARVAACLLSGRLPPRGVAERMGVASCIVTRREDLSGKAQTHRPEDVVSEGSATAPPLALGEEATIIFTTGSTGAPKAVVHSVGNHLYSAKGANENMPLTRGDRWLLGLPLHHVGGLGILFRCVLAGATIVSSRAGESVLAAIRRTGCTHVSLVGTQLGRVLQEKEEYAPDSLRAVLVGGSSVSSKILGKALERGYRVHTTYGLTEMSSQVTTAPYSARPERRDTSGRLLPYRKLRVGSNGEILVKGEVLFAGYLEDGQLRRPLDADGWFHSGDIGALDADGFLRVLGRMDNMFVSGGENIHPEEIERALCLLRGVEQAVVVPIDDTEYGQRPVAFVKGRMDGWEDLRRGLVELLPRFKIPQFLPWPDVPVEQGMKISRSLCRRLALERFARG